MSTGAMPDYAGLISWTRNRDTGTRIGVYNGEEAGFDTTDGTQPWSTVCEDHGEICSHDTRARALGFAPCPREWCSQCQAMAPGEKVKL